MNSTKVSIVMCTYNGDKYLREQLDSILNQTYPLFEIIIQDDASTDTTWDIIKEYEERHDFIKSFRNESNIGVNLNFKTAFLKASGDFIAPSDQDDIWYPNKIETLVSLIADKLLAFANSKVLYIDGKWGEYPFSLHSNIEQCIWSNSMSGHTCLFKSSMSAYIQQAIDLNIKFDLLIAIIGYSFDSCISTKENLQTWRRHDLAITKTCSYLDSQETKNGPKNKLYKLYFVIGNLLLKKKSKSIEKYFLPISIFFCRLNQQRHLAKLCSRLADQSLVSYVMARVTCIKHRHKMFPATKPNSLRQKLAFISFSFRFPFTFWYDNHSELYL